MLPAVLLLLHEARDTESGSKSWVLYRELTSASVLLGMHAVRPLLRSLDCLTQVLQRSALYPGDVSMAVKMCKDTIKLNYADAHAEIDGDNFKMKWAALNDLISLRNTGDRSDGSLTLCPSADGEEMRWRLSGSRIGTSAAS